MSELDSSVPQDPSSSRPVTAGQLLRQARQAKGMHLGVLSLHLKVSVKQLEALEADCHDELKGAAFVRALSLSVCRQLGTDPAPILALLPKAAMPKALEPTALELRQTAPRPPAGKGISRQVLVLAVLMLLGVAALVWWPAGHPLTVAADESQDAPQAAVPLGQSTNPVEVAVPAASETPASVGARPRDDAVVPSPASSASSPLGASARVPSASAPLPVEAVASLVIRLQADGWVEVRDGKGQMPVRRMAKAGEVLQLNPAPPLFVYLGRADSAELSWQGQSIDLRPHTQNNEARLQIKP